MATRQSTLADRIAAAKDTGKEVIFFADESANTGTEYEFTPAGIADFLITEEGFAVGGDIPQGVAVTDLTDDTEATANDTVENIPAAVAADTDTSAASLTSVNASLTAVENDIADLTAKINEILGSLRDAGIIDT